MNPAEAHWGAVTMGLTMDLSGRALLVKSNMRRWLALRDLRPPEFGGVASSGWSAMLEVVHHGEDLGAFKCVRPVDGGGVASLVTHTHVHGEQWLCFLPESEATLEVADVLFRDTLENKEDKDRHAADGGFIQHVCDLLRMAIRPALGDRHSFEALWQELGAGYQLYRGNAGGFVATQLPLSPLVVDLHQQGDQLGLYARVYGSPEHELPRIGCRNVPSAARALRAVFAKPLCPGGNFDPEATFVKRLTMSSTSKMVENVQPDWLPGPSPVGHPLAWTTTTRAASTTDEAVIFQRSSGHLELRSRQCSVHAHQDGVCVMCNATAQRLAASRLQNIDWRGQQNAELPHESRKRRKGLQNQISYLKKRSKMAVRSLHHDEVITLDDASKHKDPKVPQGGGTL